MKDTDVMSNRKKGFVLTMDVAISIAIVGLIIVAISQMKGTDVFPELEAKRLATDIVAALDYTGVLDTYDKNKIEANLSQLLPSNLNMSMTIKRFNAMAFISQIQINANITDNFLAGKWWLASSSGNNQSFYLVEYRVRFR